MTKGRPPKPVAELQRLGTYRHDRHQPDMAANMPVANGAFGEDSQLLEVFDRVMNEGIGWLKATDEPTLFLLRRLLMEADDLNAAVKADNSLRRDLRDVTKKIIMLLAALGFDPTSRSRLGIAEVKARSRLQEIQDRARRANA